MGPQQSSSPLLPLLFQSPLPLRCAPSLGLFHHVRHVFTAAARPWLAKTPPRWVHRY